MIIKIIFYQEVIMKYGSTPFEEIIFAMMLYVEHTDVSRLKEYKMNSLNSLISSRNEYYLEDTYDEYYEDVDDMLNESNANFFDDSHFDSESFTCYGILDDDDLSDYDKLLK